MYSIFSISISLSYLFNQRAMLSWENAHPCWSQNDISFLISFHVNILYVCKLSFKAYNTFSTAYWGSSSLLLQTLSFNKALPLTSSSFGPKPLRCLGLELEIQLSNRNKLAWLLHIPSPGLSKVEWLKNCSAHPSILILGGTGSYDHRVHTLSVMKTGRSEWTTTMEKSLCINPNLCQNDT